MMRSFVQLYESQHAVISIVLVRLPSRQWPKVGRVAAKQQLKKLKENNKLLHRLSNSFLDSHLKADSVTVYSNPQKHLIYIFWYCFLVLLIKSHIVEDNNQQLKLHIMSHFLKCNQYKFSTLKTSSLGIKILQKIRYEYHKLNKLKNLQTSNKSNLNKK